MSESERRRFSPEYRRRQILEAARSVLMADPDASIQDVANEAGVTRQLVGLYFPGGGTAPIFAALFDDFASSIPTLVAGASALAGESSGNEPTVVDEATIRARISTVVNAFFDWAQEGDYGSWVFSSGRDRPGSGIGKRWDEIQDLTAGELLALTPAWAESEVSRAAMLLELEGFAELLERLLDGRIGRDDAFRIAMERFFALYTVVLPALSV